MSLEDIRAQKIERKSGRKLDAHSDRVESEAQMERTGYNPYPARPLGFGSEIGLSQWASGYRVVGWATVGIGVMAIFFAVPNLEKPWAMAAILGGIGLATVGSANLFFAALLDGAADVIRLLKRSNDLPYGGELRL